MLASEHHAFDGLDCTTSENLKIGKWHRRITTFAGDEETVQMAETILAQERAAADKLYGAFDRAVAASLEEVGVG